MENLTKDQNRQNTREQPKSKIFRERLRKKIFSSKEIEKQYHFRFARKVVHVAFSLFGFGFLFAPELWHKYIAIVLYTLTTLSLIGDTIRIYIPTINTFIYRYFGMLFIRRDQERYSSGTYYLIGSTVVTLLFPYPIAGMGIIFLGIGDFMASIGGVYFKSYFPYHMPKTHKTWIGCFFFILPTSIIGYLAGIPLWMGIVSSIASSLSEVYLTLIDDNLSVPIVGSLCLYLLTIIG